VIETIPAALDGERLDRVVSLITGISRSGAAELVAGGGVLLDGAVATSGKGRVHEGQQVEVVGSLPVVDHRPEGDPSVHLQVVHEDDDVIVVDKPEGLVVHPGPGNEGGTLVNGLLARYPEIAGVGEELRPGIVHRLDKGTSGLLVVARSARAYDSLTAQLASRRAGRQYAALVWGIPEVASGLVDAPIGRSPRDPLRMAVVADGKEARTRYDVRKTFTEPVEAALIECRLETGRTHQIRVHLLAIGHPVVGDPVYTGIVRQGIDAPRPMLHAERLSFLHPADDRPMTFSSPWPEDLLAVLAGLS
jgi:23S rRNA pseudouridine1911/1915/1917 synthase